VSLIFFKAWMEAWRCKRRA